MNDYEECRECLWSDECYGDIPCRYFDDEKMELSDAQLGRYIEKERLEFRREWARYARQYE